MGDTKITDVKTRTESNQCYCIRCGDVIPCNRFNPYCYKCSSVCSSCNRFSASEAIEIYCHLCGQPDYVTESNPFCPDCEDKFKELYPDGHSNKII